MPVLADEVAVEKVAGVELDARLGAEDFEDAPGFRVLEPRGELGGRRQPGIEREIMVIAATEADLRVGPVADAVGDRGRRPEVKDGAGDGLELALAFRF